MILADKTGAMRQHKMQNMYMALPLRVKEVEIVSIPH